MKSSYLSLTLAFFLAGCSTCSQPAHVGGAQSLSGQEQSGCARKTAEAPSTQYRLSDLASETVFDKAGNQVARLDDLTMGANGRIISVTLAPIAGGGGKVTIPFEKLKIKKERNGTLSLETDVVLKVSSEGAPASQPHRLFRWKQPA